MHSIEVAIPVPVKSTYTYLSSVAPAPGTRVIVPFGRRKLVGVVLGNAPSVPQGIKLREIEQIVDDTPSYSPLLLDLGRWLSAYYFHPLGETLRVMLPASSTKTKKDIIRLTPQGQLERTQGFSLEGRLLKHLFGPRKESISSSAAAKKMVTQDHPNRSSDIENFSLISIESLLKLGLIEREVHTLPSGRKTEDSPSPPSRHRDAPRTPFPPKHSLTPSQKAAFERIMSEGFQALPEGRKPILLHGITGSGKTELYLQTISEILLRSDQQDQILVLVPEISLTPQMTYIFEQRFPGLTSVVHSAMTDKERWTQLNRIRENKTKILIGPRSAVFGPFARLKLIIVDEEHDGSYKQSSGLTYNGRDVAVLRGKMEQALVILGSATPSLESYQNALSGRYLLIELPERVTGRKLPDVEFVSIDNQSKVGRSGVVLSKDQGVLDPQEVNITVAPQILENIRDNLEKNHQAMILVNRRGYAYYLFKYHEKKTVQCPHCSISLTLHARGKTLRCHLCDFSTSLNQIIDAHPTETFVAIGYGSQKAEDFLAKEIPRARIARVDSDSTHKRDVLPKILHAFRSGDLDILVGTQILAKGHDFPNVTLIAILEVDQLLALPDFRSGERTFQLIVQAAGRAGRADLPGRVLIQCSKADHPIIFLAAKQDYKSFADLELKFRALHGYPPFSKMIALEFASESQTNLAKLVQCLEDCLNDLAKSCPQVVEKVRILGPSVPPVEKVNKRFRRTLILSSTDQTALRKVTFAVHDYCSGLNTNVKISIDVDPQSLM